MYYTLQLVRTAEWMPCKPIRHPGWKARFVLSLGHFVQFRLVLTTGEYNHIILRLQHN